MIKLKFIVSIPDCTDIKKDVFIVGNIPELGSWNPSSIKMKRVNKTISEKEIQIDKKECLKIEYKYTLGGWETVEKGKNFEEIGNRSIVVENSITIEDKIVNWTNEKKITKHTLTGNIAYHHNFYSKILKNERTVIIYLPSDYTRNKTKKYPVLYMHDGQNIFDAATSFLSIEWNADETAEKLINENRIQGLIIVGIYNNSNRIYEYTSFVDEKKGGGGGDRYVDFIVAEVKPFIDKKYRTLTDRDNTSIAGSSLGGLISLYALFKYPEIFGKAGVISPSFFWAENEIFRYIERSKKLQLKETKIYLDIGTREGDTLHDFSGAVTLTRRMKNFLIKKGFIESQNLVYFEDEGAKHNESAWAKRFDKVLLFFYGNKRKK